MTDPEQVREEINHFLTEHSNSGTFHLIEAAQHFFTARLMSEKVQQLLTPERIDTLADEAWSTFVSSSLHAYHTWVMENAKRDLDREAIIEASDEVYYAIEQIKEEWDEWVQTIKLVMLPIT